MPWLKRASYKWGEASEPTTTWGGYHHNHDADDDDDDNNYIQGVFLTKNSKDKKVNLG